MLRNILESLNVNNLIYMMDQVQKRDEGVIGFPEETLKKQGEHQVIIVLKERRKKVCEFILNVIKDCKAEGVSHYGSFN
jgi:hypothetical protein